MTLQKKLQINIVMSNYNQRSGSYSSSYDYILLDSLAGDYYSNFFRSDLKNLKIKTKNNTECQVLYIPSYGSQPAAILVRVPVSQISKTTKLLLDVHDTSTTFSSTLTTGNEVLMFDANSDTYSRTTGTTVAPLGPDGEMYDFYPLIEFMRKDIRDELPMYTKLFILSSVGVLMNAPNRIIKGEFRA